MTLNSFGQNYALAGIAGKRTTGGPLSAYVALHTSSTPSSSNELSGGGYSRQSVSISFDQSQTRLENTSTVTFSFTGNAGTATGASICAGSTRGRADLIFSGSISSTATSNGTRIEFGTDDITLTVS